MNRRYLAVAERAHFRCEYCRAPEAVFNEPFDVEHIYPISLGGSSDLDNLALSCGSCNVFKSDVVKTWGDETQSAVPLFNPRIDRWADHFSLDEESALLAGLTETGRAMVTLLRLNRPRHLNARRHWIQWGLFP